MPLAKLNETKRAGKDYPADGIKKGEHFYWWQHFRGPVRRSKTRPRPSQLEGNEDLAEVYSIEEEIDDYNITGMTAETAETAEGQIEDWGSRLDDVAGNIQDKFNNMPEQFQEGDAGQTMQDRIEGINEMAEGIRDCTPDQYTTHEDEDEVFDAEAWKAAVQEAAACFCG